MECEQSTFSSCLNCQTFSQYFEECLPWRSQRKVQKGEGIVLKLKICDRLNMRRPTRHFSLPCRFSALHFACIMNITWCPVALRCFSASLALVTVRIGWWKTAIGSVWATTLKHIKFSMFTNYKTSIICSLHSSFDTFLLRFTVRTLMTINRAALCSPWESGNTIPFGCLPYPGQVKREHSSIWKISWLFLWSRKVYTFLRSLAKHTNEELLTKFVFWIRACLSAMSCNS